MAPDRYSLSELNGLERDDFTRIVGPVFEHSPWIAELTWPKRPFESLEVLHLELCETVLASTEQRKLQLIQAHPDLVGRAALVGKLTASSAREQADAGLDCLNPGEIAMFTKYNRDYREKFGFPFVICTRLNRKEAILAGFEKRLHNLREREIQIALEEIFKIAELRLRELLFP